MREEKERKKGGKKKKKREGGSEICACRINFYNELFKLSVLMTIKRTHLRNLYGPGCADYSFISHLINVTKSKLFIKIVHRIS